MVVIEALFGAAQAFFQPAYTGLIPQTVPDDHDPGGAGADASRPRTSPILVGPAIGTVLVLGRRRGRGVRARRGHVRDLSAALLMRVQPAARAARAAAAETVLPVAARRLGARSLAPLGVGDDRAFAGRGAVQLLAVVRLARRSRAEFYGGAGVFGVLEAVAGVGAVLGALIGDPVAPERARCAPGCC